MPTSSLLAKTPSSQSIDLEGRNMVSDWRSFLTISLLPIIYFFNSNKQYDHFVNEKKEKQKKNHYLVLSLRKILVKI